jgi:hypothetical protein
MIVLHQEDPKHPVTKVRRQITPRGLSEVQAADYVGVSSGLFGQMVDDGRMPKSIRINRRKVWDIRDLDDAFDALKDEPQANPWDDLA